ncbi:hypothetical protein AB0H58_29190 [Nocardia neocaledoniensis]|uniref:Uncharacterized protein n=1 Tax=Nocardia neocaledoniensis TaxID=236511 RepID=A0A317NLU6_9NOCA|nr:MULTISPECIES: hypothetical protein [Nocardia]PWV76025.1 hypothetical protein DFR69_104127 [Nocardia neocaledoniensis]UGT52381.1 hypothetical protein LTT85_16685 [Nocardia asteroides]GEM30662.1 hypothetical protein NN3_16690 [Nocardia neocaledoniensis NBRC 108232]
MTSPATAGKYAQPAPVKDDFTYTVDGTDIVLPSLSYLKPGLVRRIRRLGDVDAMYTLLELSLTADALDALDEMEPDAYHEFLEAWRAHSGLSLGES